MRISNRLMQIMLCPFLWDYRFFLDWAFHIHSISPRSMLIERSHTSVIEALQYVWANRQLNQITVSHVTVRELYGLFLYKEPSPSTSRRVFCFVSIITIFLSASYCVDGHKWRLGVLYYLYNTSHISMLTIVTQPFQLYFRLMSRI